VISSKCEQEKHKLNTIPKPGYYILHGVNLKRLLPPTDRPTDRPPCGRQSKHISGRFDGQVATGANSESKRSLRSTGGGSRWVGPLLTPRVVLARSVWSPIGCASASEDGVRLLTKPARSPAHAQETPKSMDPLGAQLGGSY
jgi:hypothetical protein